MSNKRITVWEFFIIMVFFSAIVFGVTYGFGTINSGWHLVDDHEFMEYAYNFKYLNKSLFEVIKETMAWDTTTRNNSLYYPFRITMSYFVGLNAYILSLIKAIETIIAMVLLYCCGKKITGVWHVSVLFTLTCMVGYQSAVWWKLGPEQVQALICFGISFLLLLKWLEEPGKTVYGIISAIFAVAMGFFHESFILVMPFLAFYIVCEERVAEYKRMRWYTWSILALCAAIIIQIVARLGFKSYTAVSFGADTSITEYVDTLMASLHIGLKWYWAIGLVLVGILLTYFDKLKANWKDLFLAGIFIAPQFVLYSKEGISERYIIPVIIGYSLFFIVYTYRDNILTGIRKKLYICALIVMLLLNARGGIVEADYYRFRGESVTKMLEAVAELSGRNYNVMSCLGISNPEADWTVEMYLKSQGMGDIYYWDYAKEKVTDYRPSLNVLDADYFDASIMDVIVAYNTNDRHYTVEPNLDLTKYTCIRCGSIDVYFKNEVTRELEESYFESFKVKPTIYGIGKSDET